MFPVGKPYLKGMTAFFVIQSNTWRFFFDLNILLFRSPVTQNPLLILSIIADVQSNNAKLLLTKELKLPRLTDNNCSLIFPLRNCKFSLILSVCVSVMCVCVCGSVHTRGVQAGRQPSALCPMVGAVHLVSVTDLLLFCDRHVA